MIPQNSFLSRQAAICLCIVLLTFATEAHAAPRVLAAASTKAVFVAHVETVESSVDHSQMTHTSIYRRLLSGDGRFTKLITLNGRITSLSSESDEAVVLLEGGQWMTIWPGNNPLGPSIPNAQIYALGSESNSATGGVWAIALEQPNTLTTPPSTSTSLTVSLSPTTVAATTSTTTATTFPASTTTTIPATSPAISTTSTSAAVTGSAGSARTAELAIYHLAGSSWERICALPPGLETISANDFEFAVSGSTITLGVGGFEGIRIWTHEVDRWIASKTIRAGHLPADFRILECGLPPVVWFNDGQQGLSRGGSEELLPPDGLSEAAPRAAACVAEAIRVFSETDDKAAEAKLAEQAYNLRGEPIGKRSNLAIDASGTSGDVESWISTLLTVLVTALLVTSAWRRPVPVPDILEKAQAKLAPQGWRLLAGVIDLLPVAIAVAIQATTFPAARSLNTMPTYQEMLPFYIGIAVYILHTSVGELIAARSIGKYLVGLRVISSDGKALSPMSVLIRNILRLIDVMLCGIPLSLILLSPMRQRLGDIAARTIVIHDGILDENIEPAEPVEPSEPAV